MRELDDALKSIDNFRLLFERGMQPEKSLEKSLKKVTHEYKWEERSFTTLEFRVGQLKVKALAHIADSNGLLSVGVWYSGKESDDDCIFDIYADPEFVARIVVDYINEHEAMA